MSIDDPMARREELVFAIDLTTEEMVRVASDVEALKEAEKGSGVSPPYRDQRLPEPPPTEVSRVAILVDGWDAPLLLPIEPTRDVVMLDALARLLRIAVLAGERVPAVALEYGEELERRLVFERKLPGWVFQGIDAGKASRLPPELKRVLGPKKR